MARKVKATKTKKAVPQWKVLGYDSAYEQRVHKNDKKVKFHDGILLSYFVEHTYEPDFTYPTSDEEGKPLVVETKGNPWWWDRKAWLRMYEQNKDKYAIKLLFEREVRLPGCSKLTNVGWATKHGIPCAVGDKIPDKWFGR